MPKRATKAKARTYKKTQRPNTIKDWLKNKWVIIALVLVVALAGIIAIRASQAAGLSGRMPDTGEPHIDYTFNPLNGTVTLKKSTNGQTRVAPNIDEAYVIGQQMYDEMIAAQIPPPNPSPSPSPSPTPSPSPSPGSSTGSTGGSSGSTSTSASSPSSSSSSSSSSGSTESSTQQTTSTSPQSSNSSSSTSSNTSNTSKPKQSLVFTLRRTVELLPKLPSDSSQVASVHFLVDSKEIGSSTASPYSYKLNTRNYPNGSHKITTSIVGKNSKIISASSYNINIDNAENPFGKLLEILGW